LFVIKVNLVIALKEKQGDAPEPQLRRDDHEPGEDEVSRRPSPRQ
jgi:hypothetical protein